MSLTEEQLRAQRFRFSVGFVRDDTTSMPDDEVDEYYDEAEEKYPDNTDSADAAAHIIYFEGLFADAAKLATYKKNQTTENVSDIFTHIQILLDRWDKKLAYYVNLSAGAESSVRSGKTTQIPRRRKEYPCS